MQIGARGRSLLTALLGLVVLLNSGCDGKRPSGSADKATDSIRIGEYGSMTGSEATFGQSTDQGIKLAVKETNAAGGVGGKQIELVAYDDKGETKETGTVVTRLVTRDKVAAVIGEVASGLSLAAAPICQQHQVPMISPSSTNPQVTEIGDMISRVCFIDPFQGYVCAKFAHDNEKATKVAILYDQAAPYSTGLAEQFRKAFEALGGVVSTQQSYTAGDQDFTAQLTTIRGKDPQMVFIPGYYSDVGNIALQARKLGITVPLMGGDGWDSSKLAEIAGPAIQGCFYSNHYAPEDPSPRVHEFIEKYKAEYGQTPDGLAALGYDAAKLLFAAMERAASLTGTDLAQAISDTRDFAGVTGTITIDKERNAVKPAVILKMVDGTPKYVTTIEPPK